MSYPIFNLDIYLYIDHLKMTEWQNAISRHSTRIDPSFQQEVFSFVQSLSMSTLPCLILCVYILQSPRYLPMYMVPNMIPSNSVTGSSRFPENPFSPPHTVSHVTLLVSSGKFMSGSAFSGRCFFFVRGALIFGQGGAPFISGGHFLDLEKSTAKFRGA